MDEARGKVLQQAEVDFGVDQVDELQPHLVGQGPQGRLFAEEAKLHGGLVQAHPLGLGSPGLLELLGIQQPLAEKHFADIHGTHHPSLTTLINPAKGKVSFFSDANWARWG